MTAWVVEEWKSGCVCLSINPANLHVALDRAFALSLICPNIDIAVSKVATCAPRRMYAYMYIRALEYLPEGEPQSKGKSSELSTPLHVHTSAHRGSGVTAPPVLSWRFPREECYHRNTSCSESLNTIQFDGHRNTVRLCESGDERDGLALCPGIEEVLCVG